MSWLTTAEQAIALAKDDRYGTGVDISSPSILQWLRDHPVQQQVPRTRKSLTRYCGKCGSRNVHVDQVYADCYDCGYSARRFL